MLSMYIRICKMASNMKKQNVYVNLEHAITLPESLLIGTVIASSQG